MVGACVVVRMEVTGAKEAPGAGELGWLGAQVAGWISCSFVSAEGTLVRCLYMELATLDVTERAELVERLCAMCTFGWARIGPRS